MFVGKLKFIHFVTVTFFSTFLLEKLVSADKIGNMDLRKLVFKPCDLVRRATKCEQIFVRSRKLLR